MNETMTLTVGGSVGERWLCSRGRPGFGFQDHVAASPAATVLSIGAIFGVRLLVVIPRIEALAEDGHIHGHGFSISGAPSVNVSTSTKTPDEVPGNGASSAGWASVLYVQPSKRSGFFHFARHVARAET